DGYLAPGLGVLAEAARTLGTVHVVAPDREQSATSHSLTMHLPIRARDLELIALIRHLVHEERYTIEGAKQRIDELRQEGAAAEAASRALERSFVRALRTELEELLELLGP
ncbi:MAG TPA: 5'/3'-nucleotidase SurE, partial [Longimicrobiaceae bacterium]|nr:5'/3'-nucleotidase SurE [Longimicrobiaceae bacterium]